ncbi:MAG: hypothetical protein KJZ78_08480, partial [Bryobacteraceae bacterium]|nr:hypothetical protein [Bryobacteraceae bacterium]
REDVLWAAYVQVRANQGAPGVDRQTFEEIENGAGIDAFLNDVRQKLVGKRYKPLPVRRVFIPKADGTQRPLGIPVIADRVVQAAVKMVIEPLFEASFRDFSYGFRPRKSAHQAQREVVSGRRRPELRRVASFLRCLQTSICIGWTEPGKDEASANVVTMPTLCATPMTSSSCVVSVQSSSWIRLGRFLTAWV